MNRSESISKLAVALTKAQKKIGSATKDAANPYFKSNYADLNSVMAACKDALNENGIIVLQPVSTTTEGDVVETILLHESGEFVSSSMKLILAKQDMQAYGSAVSYARRYSLQSMCFIGAEDDDGEATMGRGKQAPPSAKAAPAPAAVKTEEPKKDVAKSVAAATKAAKVVEAEVKAQVKPAEQPKAKPAVAARLESGW